MKRTAEAFCMATLLNFSKCNHNTSSKNKHVFKSQRSKTQNLKFPETKDA